MGDVQRYNATRYIVPLREGGSLPAVLDTEDGGMYVVKFRGAGQGAKALIAEILAAKLGIALGFSVPELGLVMLDESFGRSEKDPEIQDILKASRGVNVGLRYLEGAFNYDPVAIPDVDPELAASIVWFDALITNIDRTPRNPNLMLHDGTLWMIDHGASLYFHHNWGGVTPEKMQSPFIQIRDHVLLPFAGDIQQADERLVNVLDAETVRDAVQAIPDELLSEEPTGAGLAHVGIAGNREAYAEYFLQRLAGKRPFVAEAIRAQQAVHSEPPQQKGYRR